MCRVVKLIVFILFTALASASTHRVCCAQMAPESQNQSQTVTPMLALNIDQKIEQARASFLALLLQEQSTTTKKPTTL